MEEVLTQVSILMPSSTLGSVLVSTLGSMLGAGPDLPVHVLAQAADAAATDAAQGEGGIMGWIRAQGPVWIAQYGAWFIFFAFIVCGIGLHISEDFLLIPAGALIFHGHMSWSEVLVAAYFGLIIGDTGWIWVCRNFGTRLIHSKRFKRMMHPRRLLEAKYAMEQRGAVMLVLARFIPGTRTPALTMSGILHMAWWKFLAIEFATVAITVPVQVGIGYIGAVGYEHAKNVGNIVTLAVAGTAILVACVFAYKWWQQAKARKGPRPRAPVSWLRTFGR